MAAEIAKLLKQWPPGESVMQSRKQTAVKSFSSGGFVPHNVMHYNCTYFYKFSIKQLDSFLPNLVFKC